MIDLERRAFGSLLLLCLFIAVPLFALAGTLNYWEAWIYVIVMFGTSFLTTIYLLKHDRALLERRLRGGPAAEKERTQKIIMVFASLGFIALLAIPALDHRFGWSRVPPSLVVAGDILIVIGFIIIFFVFKENSYSSAIIEIAENQTVISTGPYALMRHPMYAGGIVYLVGTPLALGSYWGLLAVAATAPFLVWRLIDEEDFLVRNLAGYSEYKKRVKYRLAPLLW